MLVVERHVDFVFCLGGGELLVPLRRDFSARMHRTNTHLSLAEYFRLRRLVLLRGSSGFDASEFSTSVSLFLSTYMFIG